MPHDEYVSWQHYYAVEPWGSHIDDMRAGQIAAVVANVNRDPRSQPEPYGPLDFATWNALAIRRADAAKPREFADPEAASAAILDLFARTTAGDTP